MIPTKRTLLGALMALALTQTIAAGQDPTTTTARISGQIVDADTRTPVAGAHVALWNQSGIRPPDVPNPQKLMTGPDGRFVFNIGAAGRYRIEVTKTGYTPPTDGTNALVHEVGAGESLLDLAIPVRRGGTIAGLVLGTNNTPVADVSVSVLRRFGNGDNTTRMSGVAKTGKQGEYLFSGLEPGDYVVRAAPPPTIEGLPTYYPGSTELSRARVLTVKRGGTVPNVIVTILSGPGFIVSGTIVDAAGMPLAGVRIGLTNDARTGVTLPRASPPTGADGAFRISGVVPDTYRLEIMTPGASTWNGTPAPAALTVGDADVAVRLVFPAPAR